MKPLISYYGGKQKMSSRIIPLIPKHTVYVEPFAGGCSILFNKPYPKTTNIAHYREVINDINGDIINLYHIFQTRFDEIKHLLDFTLYSEEEHKKAHRILNGNIKTNNLMKAWAYYVNIQQSFSNVLGRGWARCIFSKNAAITWSNRIKNLGIYRNKMSCIYISNTDALKCIKQWDSPQTFFYCDPPYIGTDQGHYSGYKFSDFLNLIEMLKNIKGSFILSTYSINNFVFPLDWELFKFNSICSASSKGTVNIDRSKKSTQLGNRKRTELVFRKINKKVRPEIQKLYDSGIFDCFKGDNSKPKIPTIFNE